MRIFLFDKVLFQRLHARICHFRSIEMVTIRSFYVVVVVGFSAKQNQKVFLANGERSDKCFVFIIWQSPLFTL